MENKNNKLVQIVLYCKNSDSMRVAVLAFLQDVKMCINMTQFA